MSVKGSKQGFDSVYGTVRNIQSRREGLLQDVSSLDNRTTSSTLSSANGRPVRSYL